MSSTKKYKILPLLAGPIVFSLITFFTPFHLSIEANSAIGFTCWMLIWWVSEVIPIFVTSLLPIVILPLFHIQEMKVTTAAYGNPSIFLFMGGFFIALALEKWNLHRRIALKILKMVPTTTGGILFGFMFATFILSMWISNTATTLMMLPIALSVMQLIYNSLKKDKKQIYIFQTSIMIGIAYSANVGGMATIIGTPPNIVLVNFMREIHQMDIDFLTWMVFALPFSLVLFISIFFILRKLIFPCKIKNFSTLKISIENESKKLHKMSTEEKRVLFIFLTAALFWIFRSFLNQWISFVEIRDEMIAMALSISLFIIPAKNTSGRLLNWQDTQKMAWGILLLFGGGMSLATALYKTGVIEAIGGGIADLQLSKFTLIISLILITMLLTEIASNIALIFVFLPVVSAIAVAKELPLFMITSLVTIASSCAFLFPMSTPPNTIVFASGYVKIPQMLRAGILVNIVSLLFFCFFIIIFEIA